MGFFSFMLIAGLVLVTLWHVQQLQGAVNDIKAQNEQIMTTLNSISGEPKPAQPNKGEETQ